METPIVISVKPKTVFPNYLDMPARTPISFWLVLRYFGLVAFVSLAGAVAAWPQTWLPVFWGLGVPALPLVFLIAPGFWRNVCPLAATNQAFRLRGKSREATAPGWLREYGFAISTALFIGFVLLRKAVLNRSGPATSLAIVAVLIGAALGGYLFKGKSGWCSSICPLLPVQRVYGQAPFVGVANAHCRPCVGCTKNCYDFNPRVSYLADMNDSDLSFRGYRRLFVGAFPGLILGYFLVPDAGRHSVAMTWGRTLLWVAGSVAIFVVLDTYGRFANNTLPPLFGGVAFGTFYWYGSQRIVSALTKLFGGSWSWLVAPARAVAIALVVAWFVKARLAQRHFAEELAGGPEVRVDLSKAKRAGLATSSGRIEVTFAGGPTVPVAAGSTLLEAAERAKVSIGSGCRMGVCGADPVAVLDGFDSLSPIGREEADTLERLGLGGCNRLACMARAVDACTVSIEPDRSAVAVPSAPTFTPDASVQRVVIIGNGVAGVTVADFLRRAHPECAIDIVGDEPHHLYNRMAIGRLIHSRQGMQGLYLLPDDWYDNHHVTPWLNTRLVDIDRDGKTVRLGTGEVLPYDRLVVASGARSTVPAIDGFGLPGSFVLRAAADAMHLRRHVQQLERRIAVVAGGGLLGLEAAHAMHELGLTVTVFERSDRLLRRALDPAASAVLRAHFEDEGIRILTNIEVAGVDGDARVERVRTTDGQALPCDVLVVAAGMTPNSELAADAGLAVRRGVLVDDRMCTNDPDVYAVGDVAEHDGQLWGLWPVAVQQAKVAATNLAGGDAAYRGGIPVTMLKGVGLDMLSFGRTEERDADLVVADRPDGGHRYRKLVVNDGRVVGGVFLGFAESSVTAQECFDDGRVLDESTLDSLRASSWVPFELNAHVRARQ